LICNQRQQRYTSDAARSSSSATFLPNVQALSRLPHPRRDHRHRRIEIIFNPPVRIPISHPVQQAWHGTSLRRATHGHKGSTWLTTVRTWAFPCRSVGHGQQILETIAVETAVGFVCIRPNHFRYFFGGALGLCKTISDD